MKTFLLPHLICPACLPHEQDLIPAAGKQEGDEIITGHLLCSRCRRKYPIRDGIAVLLTNPEAGTEGGQWRYEERGVLETYLWSHFADLAGDQDASQAYDTWAGLVPPGEFFLDAGCAVGRMAFQVAGRGGVAVGCDLSMAFVRAARKIAREGAATFSVISEGHLRQQFHVTFPADWVAATVEFIVADAQRLPFRRGTFDRGASLNLVDRVRHPLAHLVEMNRTTRPAGASLLISSPFSWSTANTPEEAWLGGKSDAPFHGSGQEHLLALLSGKDRLLLPSWRIESHGHVWWKLRSHRNHFELIRSEYQLASR